MAPENAVGQIEDFLEIFFCPQTTEQDLIQATNTAKQCQLQFFDALIIVVARSAGAIVLLSEDMHAGLEVEGLRVVNPFLTANEEILSLMLAG
jgi:predicted nucleic acid-binding protein